jgi:GH18 family chitinase
LFGQGLDIDDTVNAYLKAGVPPSQVHHGVAVIWSRLDRRPQRESWLVPELNCSFSSSVGEWNRSMYGPERQYARLRHPANSRTPDLFDALCAHIEWLQRITSIREESQYPCTSPASGTFYTYDDPATAFLKMIYINLKVPGGLGGAYVWAVKDDDVNGTIVKTMAAGLGR